MKDDEVYLRHIRDAIGCVTDYTKGGREEFLRSRQVQDAVIRNLEIIGEAVKRLSTEMRAQHPDIPWKQIAGMRDEMIHKYFGVDVAIVWKVVERHLPTLRQTIESLLRQAD